MRRPTMHCVCARIFYRKPQTNDVIRRGLKPFRFLSSYDFVQRMTLNLILMWRPTHEIATRQ